MTKSTFIKKLKELFIRFNTSPKLYQKKDFYLLMQLLGGLFENQDVSLLGEDGKIEEKYLPEISTEAKEYFPDFAYWLKQGAKRGAQVLWSPVSPSAWGYNKNPENFYLEVGEFCITESNFDDEYADQWWFRGDVNLVSLINRVRVLKDSGLVTDDTNLLLKFGILNAIHFRREDIDPEWNILIGNYTYPLVTTEIERTEHEGDNYYYSNLEFLVPVSEILTYNDSEEFIISGVEDGYRCDALIKLDSVNIVGLYITFLDYFLLSYKNAFYILQYYAKSFSWQLKETKQREIRVKYHKTKVSLDWGKLKRSTYREYNADFVKVFADYILFSDARVGTIKFPIAYPENTYEDEDQNTISERIPYSLPAGSFLIKRKIHSYAQGYGCIFTYKKLDWGSKLPCPRGANHEQFAYRIVAIHPNIKFSTGMLREYIFYSTKNDIPIYYRYKKPFIWFKIPLFRVYADGSIVFASYLEPKIMY